MAEDVYKRQLVHPVEPVAPQQIGVGAPGEQRFQLRIVMREVVLREGHVGHALGHIALVFFGERVPVSYTHLDVYKRQVSNIWVLDSS